VLDHSPEVGSFDESPRKTPLASPCGVSIEGMEQTAGHQVTEKRGGLAETREVSQAHGGGNAWLIEGYIGRSVLNLFSWARSVVLAQVVENHFPNLGR